jgi:lysyl-tRNA synthetase class 1
MPITMVPDPWERDANYARHHEVDIESILPVLGIAPEFLYQAERYRAGRYADGIRRALEHRDDLVHILDKFRDEEHQIKGEWWPVSVFCNKCNHDETDIDGWDGEWGLSYHCTHCGNAETVQINTEAGKGVKLGWRVDWPMRWEKEHVDFEPGGKDHLTQGGSYDTAKLVVKQVYNWTAPVTFRYDFIGTKGLPGKMSSSSGNVITIRDVLKVYTPELARYLFAGTRPNTEFAISFDLDVLKIYEDYDKTERIALGVEEAKNEGTHLWEQRIYELSQVERIRVDSKPWDKSKKLLQIPFRHLCNLIQIHDGDIEQAIAAILDDHAGETSYLLTPDAYLRERAERAKYWVDECAPEEFRFQLRPAGEVAATLDDTEKAAVRAMRDKVVANIASYDTDKACSQAIYDVAAENGLEGKEGGKRMFRAAYQALIGKDQGPRLANFLRIIKKDRLMQIFSAN